MRTLFSFTLVLMLVFSIVSYAGEKKVQVKVEGMTCDNCVNKVKTSLEKVDGVKSADVSLKENSALVLYDESKTDTKELKKAVNSSGFKAIDVQDVKAAKTNSKACCEGQADCCSAGKKKTE